MTSQRARSAAAALAAGFLAGGAAAAELRLEPEFASAREAFDPVGWILAQAGTGPSSRPAAAEPAAAAPSWASTLLPFLGTGEPIGFAPARWGGSLGLEFLSQMPDASRRRDVLAGSVRLHAASHFWKPWYAQVQGTVTALVSGERGGEEGPGGAQSGNSASLSGGGTLTIFPASRFPFLASIHSTDSRASGDYASSDFRNTRASVRQTWRDPLGTETWVGAFDHSAITSEAFGRDTVSQFDLRYLGTRDPHRADAVLNYSRNRQPGGAGSDILRAYASHLYAPAPEIWVSSLANLSESSFPGAAGGGFTQRIGQLSTQAVWRPAADDRLVLTGGGRVFANQFLRGDGDGTAHSLSGNAGASYAFSEEATVNASLSATRLGGAGTSADLVTFGSAGATYTSRPVDLGPLAWSLGASAQATHQAGGPEPSRTAAMVQADQQLSRTLALGDAVSLNLLLTQGAGVVEDSFLGRTDQLRAGASGGLRVATGESGEAYLGASYSGAVSRGGVEDRFQLANVQASGQLRLGAHGSLSANLTAQWVRSDRDFFRTEERTRQVYGGIAYQHARLFGVPRLRYQLSATFNEGVLLNARILGDADATRENVTQLVDSRLSYDVGRLELRVGTRLAKVDGRDDLQAYLRIVRHIGQY